VLNILLNRRVIPRRRGRVSLAHSAASTRFLRDNCSAKDMLSTQDESCSMRDAKRITDRVKLQNQNHEKWEYPELPSWLAGPYMIRRMMLIHGARGEQSRRPSDSK